MTEYNAITITLRGGSIKFTHTRNERKSHRFRERRHLDYVDRAAKKFFETMQNLDAPCLNSLVIDIDVKYNEMRRIDYGRFLIAVLNQPWPSRIRVKDVDLMIYDEEGEVGRDAFLELWRRFDVKYLHEIRLKLSSAMMVPIIGKLEETEKWKKAKSVDVREEWERSHFQSFQPRIGYTRNCKIRRWTMPHYRDRTHAFPIEDSSDLHHKSKIQVQEAFNLNEIKFYFATMNQSPLGPNQYEVANGQTRALLTFDTNILNVEITRPGMHKKKPPIHPHAKRTRSKESRNSLAVPGEPRRARSLSSKL